MATIQKEWRLANRTGFDGLTYNANAPVPTLGENDVLVRFYASSLNFRDIMIAKGTFHLPVRDNVVPASDGAGRVESVGGKVTRFKVGDDVTTAFFVDHFGGRLDRSSAGALGGSVDGSLRLYGAYNEQSLVRMPANLNYLEASTLVCAGLTAWDALFGLDGRRLMPGDWVLTQGSGGVSMFALQFAKAAGARVIATTSSAEKAARLKQLGANHVLNYHEDAKWGETAKRLTGGYGVQHVVEIGGSMTMRQSIRAVAPDGVVSTVGRGETAKKLAGDYEIGDAVREDVVDVSDPFCIIRRVYVGSRLQFEAMNRAIEANNIKPVIDDQVFSLEEAKEAFQYMWEQKHVGKLCIKID